jgi:hypothetical protein
MSLDFPANPTDGEVFGSYVWSASKGVWQSREESAAPAVVSPVPPTTPTPGDIWVDSSDGISYVYYDDGSSGQWIEMISSGVVSLASKADIDSPTFSGTVSLPSTTSIGNVSSTELGYVDGVTSAIQTQLNGKANLSGATFTGDIISPGINWILFSNPVVSQFSFSGAANTSLTLSTSIPTNARYILANIFVTASISDHQNFVLSATQWSNVQNWVNTRGTQPTLNFGTLTAKDHVTLTYYGETDGFSSNYGIWYNSQTVPASGRTVWMNNYGNSGSSGWIYFLVRGYSL